MIQIFVHAFLSAAKKKYNTKVVYQPSLDINGVASKAEVYNIETSPKVIEENEPRILKLIASSSLVAGTEYTLVLRTQSSAKSYASLLKNMREVRSDVKLVAQA